MQKKCTKCKKIKPFSEFYKRGNYKGMWGTGLLPVCNSCHSLYQKEYRNRPNTQAITKKRKQKYASQGKIKKWNVVYQQELRIKVLEKLGGSCVRCGYSDKRALQIDHTMGGGTKDRKNKEYRWYRFYREILDGKHEGKVQLLCANCNFIKRHEERSYGKH